MEFVEIVAEFYPFLFSPLFNLFINYNEFTFD